MEVYAASDGYVLQLSKGLSEYTSVDELAEAIAPHLSLQSENILLFLEDGREVKDRILAEALDRGGSGQGSKPKPEVLYLFNRETFWTEPEEWADKYQEEVYYPPSLDPGAIDDLPVAHEPFLMAQDHIHHILSLFQAQYRALSLAYQNLEHHLQPLRNEWDTLASVAAKQLGEQESLLDSAPSDLLLLPKVPIHSTFSAKRDQAGNITSKAKDEAKDKTLADFIHPRKMEEVIETCRVSHVDLQDRFFQLAGQMDELVQMSEVEKGRAEESAMSVQLEFDRALQRVQDALQAMAHASQGGRLVEVSMGHDEIMRADLRHLTALKNDYTLDVHIHLRQVAQLESRIAEVVKPLTKLESEFKSKGAFPHLSRLRELPFAYLALVLEYRWRKEFGEQFARWCNRLAQAIGGVIAPEIRRREALNKDVLSFNPFTIHGLEDSASIYCQTTYHTGGEALEVMALDKSVTDDLDDWIRRLINDIDSSFPPGPGRETLFDAVKQLTGRYEDLKLRLFGQPVSSLEARWDAEIAAHLRDSRLSHPGDDVDDERERLHQEEIEQFRQRQEEMEEEVTRLRAELDDEALARQALSAEIEVRNKASEDRQRDQEDQTELITALHAEVAQEKDRATDLGVRLQEALLDVDGMKNAEQTLIAQIQDMKDERSKRNQEMSDAQIKLADLRLTVTGLQAQLSSATSQLTEAREERDATLRNLSTEAERVMRDRIAEADGDRAVLEHQNLTLNQQVERLKAEMDEKVNSTRNAAVRQVDGYKAELSLSKAQLRDAQRREAVLSDELAMLKDNANALSSDRSHQSEMAKDAVALVTKFYETCRPLLRLVNSVASSKRTGSDEADKDNEPGKYGIGSPSSAAPSSVTDLRESVLVRSLASAQSFDLDGFSEGINRVVVRLKRYTKGYKHMRDVARNKISFTDFQKGDVALFLPTRDPSRRHWAAFNVNAPHHFLKADDKMREEAKTRDWIMARITGSEEAVAGETSETNPLGLTSGVRYQIHETEPFDPLIMPKMPRRSTSMGVNSILLQDASPNQPSRLRSLTAASGPGVEPVPTSADTNAPTGAASNLSTSLRETAPMAMSPSSVTTKPGSYFPLMSTIDGTPPTSQSTRAIPAATVPPPFAAPLSTGTPHQPTQSPVMTESPSIAKPVSTTAPARTGHHRTSSRSAASPTMREAAIFAPSSLGRPASVASSASSHPRGIPIGPSGGKAAPAMAITTSEGSGGPSPGDRGPFLDGSRRASSSSFASGQREEGGIGRSPLATGSDRASAMDKSRTEGGGGASGKATPRTVSRGFSIGGIGKQRTASNASASTADKAQTAVDILKQYEDKKK